MSKKNNRHLVRELAELAEHTEHIRKVLLNYKKALRDVAQFLQGGDVPIAALTERQGPLWRREVTDALADFEAARHQVRVRFFALATEQGMSISEVARMLGITRQLASRVAAEAEGVKS
jgi:hypothetical protein